MKITAMKRITSFLLTLVLLLPLTLSATLDVFAAWEDGMECWFCNHYHWDEYCCGTCGACSEECTNGGCYLSTHCSECGACDKLADDCPICLSCEECYVNNGWHCLSCNECHYTSEDELCGYCWFCADCMGGLCDSCGFCEVCWEVENMHCKECGNCYASYAECDFGYDHCEECCVICEQCEECLFEDGIELCETCGLCVFCCLDNAESQGCECGEYCIEDAEWYEHLCPDCGNAFCAVDMCDQCELCLDCCEANSECIDAPPICVEDNDYDRHFCLDCGDCFHSSDICQGCEAAGELICEDCCRARLEAEGCDCPDRCISDNDIEQHIKNHHNGEGPHSASPQKTWDMDQTHHWKNCRFCGEASHITGKAQHTFDKYGICTGCGFDSQQVILILKQPQSFVVKISDIHTCGEDDPLYPTNNKFTITVAAKGTTALKYQWYVSYDGGGEWLELKDDNDSFTFVSGAKTNNVTMSVPIDGCIYEHAYKCVISDENGNQVTTNVAYMKVMHVYRIYQKSQGELIGIINQPNSKNNIPMYASKGHYAVCVGEECDEYKLVPHSFGKDTRLIFDSKTGVGWHERTCIHCGFKSYLENHVHYFYDPETFECDVDFTYKNESQHKLVCLFPGCDRTHLESHDYMGWQNHGTPYSSSDKVGVAYKECQICGYSSNKKLQTYDETQDKMVNAVWDQTTDLVYVQYGYSSCDVVINGSKIIIGFAPSEYARQTCMDIKYPKIKKWTVSYYCDRSPVASKVEMDVSEYFTLTKIGNELKWSVTIPLFPGRQGGGIITFTPIFEQCHHNSGTRIKNAIQPICTFDGYTGDTVCTDCDGVIRYGEVIKCSGKHEGKLTLIPGTSKQASCEQRGYEGTYRCDHCNKTVRGKVTSKDHNAGTVIKNAVAPTCVKFGYSGDTYCACGVLLKEGEILAPRHSNLKLINVSKASCRQRGYTGDWYCYDCDQIVKYGYNIAQGEHAWSKWGKTDEVYHRHTCVVAGCGAEEKSKHTDADRDLTCDGCGYSWGSDITYYIRSLTFNIDIPKIGSKPDYTKFSSEYYYSDGTGTYKKNGVEWYDVTDQKRFVPGGVGQEFKEGHVYKVTIHFRVTLDFAFIDQESMSATINGREAVVEYVEYNEFAGISYTFEELEHIHKLDRVNKVNAKCETDGKSMYYKCSDCGKCYEDAAAKTEIKDIASWGIIKATGHTESEYKSNSTRHFKVCVVCYKEIDGTSQEHSGGEATCLKKAKCEVCSASYGTLAEHKFSDKWDFTDGAGHAHCCSVEGCTARDEVKPHVSSGKSEDKDEVCTECGYIISLSEKHVHTPVEGYKSDDDTHWRECACGEVLDEAPHVDKNSDESCDICGRSVTRGQGNEDEQSSIWMYIAIGVAAVAAALVVIFIILFVKKKKKEEKEDEEKN